MTMPEDPIESAARLLIDARRRHASAAAPTLPDAAAAYAVQARVAREFGWFALPSTARHWKSGGPSREVEPTHAELPPDGVWPSPADARGWPLRQRGIEAEVALRLRTAVDAARAATLDVHAARALVDAMVVTIEIVDSRWNEAQQAPPLAKLADLQSHGALVLGAWVPFDPNRDWSAQRCELQIGTAPMREFVGTHSMRDPTFVLPRWLRHATRDGAVLAAGTVVTTGTWCGLLPAAAGDRVVARFDGIGEASVQL